MLRNPLRRRPRGDDEPLPPGLQDYQDLQTSLDGVEDMSPEEFSTFLDDNLAELTPTQLEALQEFAQSQATYSDDPTNPQWAQASSVLAVAIEEGPEAGVAELEGRADAEEEQEEDDEFSASVQETNVAPTLEQFVADYQEQYGTLPSQQRMMEVAQASGVNNPGRVVDDFIESYLSEDDDGDGRDDETGAPVQVFSEEQLPDWVLQGVLNSTGGPITPEVERRILDYWNLYNGGEDVETIEQLIPMLQDPTLANQMLIEAAALDDNPKQGWTVSIPGQESVTIPGAVAENLFENYGFDLQGVTRMTRLLAMAPKTTLPYESTADNLLVMAGLMSAMGLNDDLSEAETRERESDKREELELGLAAAVAGAEGLPKPFDRGKDLAGNEMTRPGTKSGIRAAQIRFQQGWERYQDVGLAVVYALDPGLAATIDSTGGDPTKLSAEDELRTWDIIRRTSGQLPDSWLDFAPESPVSFFNQRFGRGRGGSGGGAGPVRRVLDPVQVKQQFAQMWEGLLLISPSDELQGQVLKELQGQLDASEQGQQFDASARILDFVRGSARYQELYGKRPSGVTEEEYLGQFLGAGQEMMGKQIAPTGAIEAGLKTGQYQTTVGSIAGSGEAWQNSRYLGRLAEAAQIFQSNT